MPYIYFEIENIAFNLSLRPEKAIETARQIYGQVSNFPAAADKKICDRIILKSMQVAETVEDYFGHSKEAERLGRKILDFANENFQDEPNILYDVMTTCKMYFHFRGDSEMCAKLNRDILNFCIKHFGNNHKRTTEAKYNLIFESLNPKNDAEEILQLTDDLRKVYKRRPSWLVATSLYEISDIIFNYMENYAPKYNSLIEFLRKNFYYLDGFAPMSPLKKLKENLKEIKRLRRKMRNVLYNSEKQIELTERLIGIFIELKNFDKAAALQKKLFRNLNRIYDKYSEKMFYSLKLMRSNLESMGRIEKAELLQQQMLTDYQLHFENCRKNFGENSLETFKALELYLLASGFYDFEQFLLTSEEYYPLYKKSCDIAENLFSAGSISREDLVSRLDIFAGYLRHCLNRPAEAVKFQEKIVQLLREVDAIAFSPTDFNIYWRRLIHCLKEFGRIDDAQKISEELQALEKKYW